MGKVTKKRKSQTYTVIDNNMSDVRVGLGMQMLSASERLNLAYGTYGSFESGHSLPSKPVLESICKLYKCLPTDLYDMKFLEYIIVQDAEWEARAKIQELEDAQDNEQDDSGSIGVT